MTPPSALLIPHLPLPRPRAVLFDWDGTLVDSVDAILQALNMVQADLNKPPMTLAEARQAMAHGTGRDILTRLHPEQADRAIALFYEYTPRLRLEGLKPVDGAFAFIQALQTRNIPMGVVSNARQKIVEAEVAHVNWAPHFKILIGAIPERPGKPAPDPVFAALNEMGIPRDQAGSVWFVGDMETDEKASESAGCPFLYYIGGVADLAERDRLAAHVKFETFAQLTEILGTLYPTQKS